MTDNAWKDADYEFVKEKSVDGTIWYVGRNLKTNDIVTQSTVRATAWAALKAALPTGATTEVSVIDRNTGQNGVGHNLVQFVGGNEFRPDSPHYVITYEGTYPNYNFHCTDKSTGKILHSSGVGGSFENFIESVYALIPSSGMPYHFSHKTAFYSTTPYMIAESPMEYDYLKVGTEFNLSAPQFDIANKPTFQPTRILSTFSGGAGTEWTSAGVLGVDYWDDTTNNMYGKQAISVKLNDVATGYFDLHHQRYGNGWDCNPYGMFLIRFKLTGQDMTTHSWSQVFRETWFRIQSGGTAWATGADCSIYSAYLGAYDMPWHQGDWYEFYVPIEALAYDFGLPAFDTHNITAVRFFSLLAQDGHNATITMNQLGWCESKLKYPTVILRQDDSTSGSTGVYSLLEKSLDRYGMSASVCLNYDGAELWNAYTKKLNDKGHDIVMHGWLHDGFGSKSVTEAGKREAQRDMIKWLTVSRACGLGGKYRWICSPGGGGEKTIGSRIQSQYFHANMNGGARAMGMCVWPPPTFSSLGQAQINVTHATGVAAWEGYIHTLVAAGNPLAIWYWHPGEWTFDQTDIDTVIDHAVQHGVQFKTLSELADEYGFV